MPRLPSALLLAACSEYDIQAPLDPSALTSSTGENPSTDPGTDACPPEGPPASTLDLDDDCAFEPATGTFVPVVEWAIPHFALPPAGDMVMSTPIVTQVSDDDGDGDIDDDDLPDVVLVSYSYGTGILRAISGDGSREWWANGSAPLQGQGGVAAGDIDGDGIVELVSLGSSRAYAFEHDGTLKWESDTIGGHIYGTSDVPSLVDLDHDGLPEIVAGRAVLSNTGRFLGAGTLGMGGVAGQNVGTCSVAMDLDGDDVVEIVTGNAAYHIDGTTAWANGLADGYPAVADMDGDGQGEVVVSGQGELRLLDTDGSLLGAVPIPGAGSAYYGGPPTIADFDGDGEPEIGVAAGSRYSVIEADGTLLWQAVTDDASSGNTGSAVFDFEGDGAAEVVYADQTRLWVFDGLTGAVKLQSDQHSNGTWLEYPVVADVDADGHAEIVVPNEAQWGGKTGIVVFGDADDSWQPGPRSWNQHAFHLDNIGDDGSVPDREAVAWPEGHNSFRAGVSGVQDGLLAPNLVVTGDICALDCANDVVTVWVQAGNEGLGAVGATDRARVEILVERDGTRSLIADVDVGSLPVGALQAGIPFEVAGLDGVDAIVARVESDVAECHDDDNEARWQGPFCP